MELILGTRGSDLALTQTDRVEAELRSAHHGLLVGREVIKTLGDKRQDLKLSEFSAPADGSAPVIDKGIFIKELETALLEGRVHVAVHSLKDVPTILDEEFDIAAVLPRAPVEDVIICRNPGETLKSLREGATVATSSVRRACQLRRLRPDLNVVDIRGNVPTRLRKLVEGDGEGNDRVPLDAIMLARAGLERLGHDVAGGMIGVGGAMVSVEILDPRRFLPAAGQGAIAMEILRESDDVRELLQAIHDEPTFRRVCMERAFLARLGAGCQTPVGILTEISGQGRESRLTANAIVFEEAAGGVPTVKTGSVSGPADQADALAAQLISNLQLFHEEIES